jgi:hypothetical protein
MMVIIGMMALRCQGQDAHGQLTDTPSTPASAPTSLQPILDLLEFVPILHVGSESLPQAPASPPPRCI